jgi:hypothetical protein
MCHETEKLLIDIRIYDAAQRWKEKVEPFLSELKPNDIEPDTLLKEVAEIVKEKVMDKPTETLENVK